MRTTLRTVVLATLVALVASLVQVVPAHAASNIVLESPTLTRAANGRLNVSGTIKVSGHRVPGEVCAGLTSAACTVGYEGRLAADGSAVALGTASAAGTNDPLSFAKSASSLTVATIDAVRVYITGAVTEYGDWVDLADTYPMATEVSLVSASATRMANGYLNVTAKVNVAGYRMPGGICSGVTESTSCRFGFEVHRVGDGGWQRVTSISTSGANDPLPYNWASVQVAVGTVDAVRAYIESPSGIELSEPQAIADTYPTATAVSLISATSVRKADGNLSISATVKVAGYRMPGGLCHGVSENSGCVVGIEVRRLTDGVWVRGASVSTNGLGDSVSLVWNSIVMGVPTADAIRGFLESSGERITTAVAPINDTYPITSSVTMSGLEAVRDAKGVLELRANVQGQGVRMPGGTCEGAAGTSGSATNCWVGLEVRMAGDESVRVFRSLGWVNGSGDPFNFTRVGDSGYYEKVEAVRAFIKGSHGEVFSEWEEIADSFPLEHGITFDVTSVVRQSGGYPTLDVAYQLSAAGFHLPGQACFGVGTTCYLGYELELVDGSTKRFESTLSPSAGDPFVSQGVRSFGVAPARSIRAYVRGAGGTLYSAAHSFVDTYPATQEVALEVLGVYPFRSSEATVSYRITLSGILAPGRVCATGRDDCVIQIRGPQGVFDSHYQTAAAIPTPIYDVMDATWSRSYVSRDNLGTFTAQVCNRRTGECISSAPQYGRLPSASESLGGGNPALNGCTCSQADPVNTQNGEFFLPVQDLSIPGIGPVVGATRTYSALAHASDGPFGYGWLASFGAKVAVVTAGVDGSPPVAVEVRQENGSRTRFDQQPDGSYAAGPWMRATLALDPVSGSWTYIRNKGEILQFDASGRLVTTADRFGNQVDYSYDAGGKLSMIAGSGGRQIALTWSGTRVASMSDSSGRTASFTYSTSGNLTSVTGVDGSIWQYGYDSSHRMTKLTKPGGGFTTNVYDSSNRVTSQTDPTGKTTQFAYSGSTTTTTYPDGTKRSERYLSGVVVEVIDAIGTSTERRTRMYYDERQNLVRTIDAMGGEATSAYDADGNELTSTDTLDQVTTRTFDAEGNVLTVTDPLGRTTSYTYNAVGQMLTSTSPAGRTQTWTYNADGTVATITSPGGQVVAFTYTPQGQVACQDDGVGHVSCTSYNSAGQPISSVDPAGNTSSTTYDSAGRPLTLTDANGLTTSVEYDGDGNVVESTSPMGRISAATYDSAGRLLTVTDPGGNVTLYSYTPTGQVATVTDPAGKVTAYTYDALDRLVSATDAEGRGSSRTYDLAGNMLTQTSPSGKVTSFAYDLGGRLTRQTDPLGKVTQFSYDAAGQLVTVKDPLNRVTTTEYSLDGEVLDVTGADGASESYVYDSNGNLTQYTNPDGAVVSYGYNPAGQLITKTEPGGRVTGYAYDVLGQVTTRAGPDGGSTTYVYDDGSRLLGIDRPGTSADVSFTYNGDGQRAQLVDVTGTTTYNYTSLGQLASVTDGGGATIGYAYDSRGRTTTITYPGGDEVDYGYDDTGLMTSVTDWLGNTSEFAWTPDGQLASETLANGVQGQFGYDDAGRATAIDYAKGATSLASYGYGYDASGQLTGFTLDDPLNAADEREFGYDPRGQVATVAGSGGYTISAAGLVTATPAGVALGYNAKLELTTAADATADSAFTFDGNGSRMAQVRTPTLGAIETTSYGYTAANALASVELPGGAEVSYASDGDGLRQSRTVGASTRAFVWNVNAAIGLLLDDGEHRYVYGPTSTPIAQYDVSDEVEFLLTDQLGSVRVITDASGAVVGSASFGVFGAVEAVSGVVSAFGFTGAWTDEETGLVYLRARDYDPATGQFLQVDPAVDDTRQPYAYAYNNPLLWTDPTGLDVWGDIGAGALAFGAGVLDDLTFGLSSAILGAVIPGYDCFTQTNPWFAAGQMTSAIVSTVLLVATGVGAAIAAAKIVATIGLKAAVKVAAAGIKATIRNTVQSVKAAVAAGGTAVAGGVRSATSAVKSFASGARGGATAVPGTDVRKVGTALDSVDDVMANPSLLSGAHPALVENILKGTPNWRVERLAKGSQAGRGWVFRQYTSAGSPTGAQLRWHPGGWPPWLGTVLACCGAKRGSGRHHPMSRSEYSSLVAAVDRLASPSDEQINYLERIGADGLADELALEFDDRYKPLRAQLDAESPAAAIACADLDAALSDLQLGWTIEALSTSSWGSVRQLAAAAASQLRRLEGEAS